jgi:single-strand DNA-binding protein
MYSNRVTLTGFLGVDAEVRNSTSPTPFTVLSLATKRSWKDRKSGEYRSQTSWHRCLCFGRVGQYASTLTKGAHVQVDGEVRTRQFTPEGGQTRSITEIRVRSIVKLDRKSEPAASGAGA